MNFNQELNISNKIIKKDAPTFIIAEAGVNHGGDMNVAKKLIDIASNAKVDAVKFQYFKTENLILKNVKKAPYQTQTTNAEESQFDMLQKLEVTMDQNKELKKYCEDKGLIFLTTPFDEESMDELDELNLSAYKVASTDLTNLPFLERLAKKKKPIFLSTGMSYLNEVKMALESIYEHNKDVVLLQCTANYPILDEEANLNIIRTYQKEFNVLVGYSDHTVGVGASPFAVPMGAKVVEKHFTLDKSLEGPDHTASLSPEELKEYVKLIRSVDTYMGTYEKKPTKSEEKTRLSLQKYLVATKEIKSGDQFTTDNIIAKRTGGEGISPTKIKDVLGSKATRDFQVDDIISI